MKKLMLPCVIVALLLGAMTLGPQLVAQEAPQAPASAQAQQDQAAPAVPDQQQAAKSFTGTIMKDGDKLVLKDVAGNMTYQLDDQAKAKKYVGKTVQVTGSLDNSSNTIHVDKITASS